MKPMSSCWYETDSLAELQLSINKPVWINQLTRLLSLLRDNVSGVQPTAIPTSGLGDLAGKMRKLGWWMEVLHVKALSGWDWDFLSLLFSDSAGGSAELNFTKKPLAA